MTKFLKIGLLLSLIIIFLGSSNYEARTILVDELSVAQLMEQLGENYDDKRPDYSIPGVSAEQGKEIVHLGFTQKPNGGKSKKQSKHFVCTSCHNTVKEDPDLSNPDPQKRLEFAQEIGVPFLQGTTLYGAVNRDTYYNRDYIKKYGDLVLPAKNNIREAIQLCAVECAQGRKLKDWEVESILAYLWELELKIDDILINGEELDLIQQGIENGEDLSSMKELLTSKFLNYSDAHFTLPPEDRKIGYGLEGDADNGKLIYDSSCLHCHEKRKYSFFYLDDSKLTFKYLKDKIKGYAPHSIYQVIRWGVPTKSGKRSYMPQYTRERLSDQMVEDLRAYIERRAR